MKIVRAISPFGWKVISTAVAIISILVLILA